MIVNHDVEDYATWKHGFDSFPPGKGGAIFHHVNRGVDNPNNVTVVAGFASREAAEAFRDNPGLSQAMAEAGVIGRPRVEISEEAEEVHY